jgi:hypothetical protein
MLNPHTKTRNPSIVFLFSLQNLTLKERRFLQWNLFSRRTKFLNIMIMVLTFWHRSFTFNSNKSPTWCNIFFQFIILTFIYSSTSFGRFPAHHQKLQCLHWQTLVSPSYCGEGRAVFVVGPAGRPNHEHSTTVTTIRRYYQKLPLQSLSSW